MRTTADEVKQILDTDLTDPRIEAFITGASLMLDEVFSDGALGEDLLTEIERWLAAHQIAATIEQQASEAKAGSTAIKYQGDTGLGLDSTMYGQNVKILDTTSRLADLGTGRRNASLYAIPQY